MQQKPSRWNISPALLAREAQGLWKGLAFVAPLWGFTGKGVLLNAGGQPINLTPIHNAPQWRGTPYGFGLSRVPATADPRILRFATNLITTSDGVGTGDFTVALLANPVSEAVVRFNFSQRTAAGSGPRLFTGANHNGAAAAAGYFLFGTRDAAGSTDVAIANMVDGRDHLFTIRRKGSTNDLFRDGVVAGSTTGTVRAITQASNESVFGGLGGDTTDGMNDATRIVFGAAWNRALSDAEMRMLARDAFCMLRPMPEWRGVWTPAGGDAVLNPADFTDSFGYETAGFLQAHQFALPDAFLAAGFEPAGFSQAHVMTPYEMNSALPFEYASLAMASTGAPPFRMHSPGKTGRNENISADARNQQIGDTRRSRTITE